jgi:hypothetical protein
MKVSTRDGLRTGILSGLLFGVLAMPASGVLVGLGVGLVFGSLFGALVAFMIRRKERVWATLRAPYEGEGILHDGPAACAIGAGYLVLTQQRIVWIPMQKSLREKRIEIARAAITKLALGRGLGAQIRIEVHTGESVQFVVRDPKAWLKQLNQMVKLLA